MTLEFYKLKVFKRVTVFRKPNYGTLGDIDLVKGKWRFERIDHKVEDMRINISSKEKEQIKRKVNQLNKKQKSQVNNRKR